MQRPFVTESSHCAKPVKTCTGSKALPVTSECAGLSAFGRDSKSTRGTSDGWQIRAPQVPPSTSTEGLAQVRRPARASLPISLRLDLDDLVGRYLVLDPGKLQEAIVPL
jgi:hypothetical protein